MHGLQVALGTDVRAVTSGTHGATITVANYYEEPRAREQLGRLPAVALKDCVDERIPDEESLSGVGERRFTFTLELFAKTRGDMLKLGDSLIAKLSNDDDSAMSVACAQNLGVDDINYDWTTDQTGSGIFKATATVGGTYLTEGS